MERTVEKKQKQKRIKTPWLLVWQNNEKKKESKEKSHVQSLAPLDHFIHLDENKIKQNKENKTNKTK